ncbi:MAG: 3-oxoacyl-ACP reductase FabG [bacterium]|nr:3-oxoacyl-ACP reductase FabG [bacterium]
MFDLTGKIALVTGASGSLGREIVLALSERGADIACHYFSNPGRAHDLVSEIQKMGVRGVSVQADLTNPEDADRIVDETVAKLGNLHILVNTAGVNRESLFIRQQPELVKEVLSKNLESVLYISRAAARVMARNKWGRLIHISSVVAHTGNLAQVAYSASKAGINGMSVAIAREMGPRNVTSNVIAPGFIASGMSERMSDERKEVLMRYIALNRTGTAREVACAVVYLASEEAGYITGSILHMNGGLHMQ